MDSSSTTLIKQYGSITDYTKWFFTETSSGRYSIANKALGASYVLAAQSDTSGDGSDLRATTYTDDTSYRDEWAVWAFCFEATVYNKYDHGYHVYYQETEAASVALINEYSRMVAERYLELYGLLVDFNSTAYFNSSIDQCKGTVTLSNIDALCDHTCRDSLPNDFYFVGSNTITYAYWTAHGIEEERGKGIVNRSFSTVTCVYLLERVNSQNTALRTLNTIGVLMHELNHQYGAIDHYHEMVGGVCRNQQYCYTCNPTSGRPETCIMNQARQDINASTIICDGCKNDILTHLNQHH